MRCHLCKENKLSKEFPFYTLTENCNHPLLHCLDCAVASVRRAKKCSQCESAVTEKNEVYQEYLETLDFLFPPEEVNDDDGYQLHTASAVSGNIHVTTLSGESATLSYHPLKKISCLKKEIESKLKTSPEKQRLVYQSKELKVRNTEGRELTLNDHKIPANSTVHLIVVLCAVPDELDKVVFDFYWGLPPGRRFDYLDVSVLVYSGREDLGYVNYRRPYLPTCPGIQHSGHADMDYISREGRQQVKVNLKSVPHHVDKLVFTLSAWAAATIAEYPYYRLKFYDVNFPDKQLCSDKVSHLEYYKSIIMCSLSKRNGRWEAISVRKGSDGFTRNYSPLRMKISQLIRDGFV